MVTISIHHIRGRDPTRRRGHGKVTTRGGTSTHTPPKQSWTRSAANPVRGGPRTVVADQHRSDLRILHAESPCRVRPDTPEERAHTAPTDSETADPDPYRTILTAPVDDHRRGTRGTPAYDLARARARVPERAARMARGRLSAPSPRHPGSGLQGRDRAVLRRPSSATVRPGVSLRRCRPDLFRSPSPVTSEPFPTWSGWGSARCGVAPPE